MPSNIDSELRAIISSSDENKWYKFSILVKMQLSKSQADSNDFSSAYVAAILNSCFSEIPESSRKQFLNYFQKTLCASIDPQEANFVTFMYKVIYDMLFVAILLRKWTQALDILESFYKYILDEQQAYDFFRVDPLDSNLNIALSVLEYLGYSAYERTADKYSPSEFEAILPIDQPGTHKFLNILLELDARAKLALTWSIEDYSGLDKKPRKLTGGQQSKQRQILQNLVKNVHNNKKTELILHIQQQCAFLTTEQLQAVLDSSQKTLVENLFDEEHAIDKELIISSDHIILTQTKVIVPDLGLHSIAMGFYGNTVCFLNRGPVIDDKPGVKIFKVTPEKRKYLLDFALPGASSFAGYAEQTLDEIEQYMLQDCSLEAYVTMKPQTSSNCSWVASKGSYFISVYLNTFKYIIENGIPIDPHSVASKVARSAYKFMSEQARIINLKEYLALNTGFAKDQLLLAKVFAKLQYPSWIRRGMQPLQAMFSNKIQKESRVYIMSTIITSIKMLEVDKVEELLPLVDHATYDEENNTAMKIAIKAVAHYAEADDLKFNKVIAILKLLIEMGFTELGADIKINPKEYCESLLQNITIDPYRKEQVLIILGSERDLKNECTVIACR